VRGFTGNEEGEKKMEYQYVSCIIPDQKKRNYPSPRSCTLERRGVGVGQAQRSHWLEAGAKKKEKRRGIVCRRPRPACTEGSRDFGTTEPISWPGEGGKEGKGDRADRPSERERKNPNLLYFAIAWKREGGGGREKSLAWRGTLCLTQERKKARHDPADRRFLAIFENEDGRKGVRQFRSVSEEERKKRESASGGQFRRRGGEGALFSAVLLGIEKRRRKGMHSRVRHDQVQGKRGRKKKRKGSPRRQRRR